MGRTQPSQPKAVTGTERELKGATDARGEWYMPSQDRWALDKDVRGFREPGIKKAKANREHVHVQATQGG